MDGSARKIGGMEGRMISIVVPCYNCKNTFKRCIRSIRNQTQKEIEIILVDDGSTDRTYDLCEFEAREDSRIKVFHQKNKGLMNAWKRGVSEATGEYIAFCDSDDYLDSNLVEILEDKVEKYHADIILYGMKVEYEDNSVIYSDNRLEEGYFAKEDIEQFVLPHFFFNGDMESRIMIMSRWTKLFKRDLLMKNMKYLSDGISIGEDVLTVFSVVLSASSLYCIKGFYPYHYNRNNESMIGKYDSLKFQKYLNLRKQTYEIANKYHYLYPEQIEAGFLSNSLLCIKKGICRCKGKKYYEIRKELKSMRENSVLDGAIRSCSISEYKLRNKIFAVAIIKKQYFIAYVLAKMADMLGIGKK